MTVEVMQRKPTAFDELRFIESIYMESTELHSRLETAGFKLLRNIEVPKVECFMYVPTALPKMCDEGAEFDIEEWTEKSVAVGVCIGGTCLGNGWDEKTKLGLQGILKINQNCSSADKAATQIFLALDELHKSFKRHAAAADMTLDIHICGYSLGGLFAEVTTVLLQDWTNVTGNTMSCRTYESPGVPEMYHEISRNYFHDAHKTWKEKIINYKSLPNPLNTVFDDVGRVLHLKNTDHISWNKSWVMKCIAGTTKRVIFWTGILRGFGVSTLDAAFSAMDKGQQRLLIGATIATEMCMDLCEIVRNHDVALMLSCFAEDGTTLPGVCLEMKQWPVYENFEETTLKLLENSSRGLILMDPRNAGLHTLFLFGGKRGFVERKLTQLPGYLPLTSGA